tara:strand:- start:184 stop:657 length:474 start_codon:yes stop_codon:yes gene_type:complete
MNKKKINGIWFYGLSGSGKTTASKFLKKKLFNKSLLIDGDIVRKYVSTDLSYTLESRLVQLNRVYGICKISHISNIFTITSTVYMNKKILDKLTKLKIITIKIERDFNSLKKYKVYKNKNVVGLDIKTNKLDTDFIYNDGKISFFKDIKKYFSNFSY